MIQGLNTEVRYRGRLCHVQTEDSGPQNPVLATHIFLGGKIVVSVRSEYRESLDRDDMETYVHQLMLKQHAQVEDDLRAGKYDNEVRGLGSARTDIPLARKGKARTMVPDDVLSAFESRTEESLVGSNPLSDAPINGFMPEPSLRPFTSVSVTQTSDRLRPLGAEKSAFESITTATTNSRVSPPERQSAQPSTFSSLMPPNRTPPPLVRGIGRSKPPPLPSDLQKTPAPTTKPAVKTASAAILTSSTSLDLSELRANLALEGASDEHFRTAHPGQRLFDPLLVATLLETDDM